MLQETIEGHELNETIKELAVASNRDPMEYARYLLFNADRLAIRNKDDDPWKTVTWIPGHKWSSEPGDYGPTPNKVMVIGKNPGAQEADHARLFCGTTSLDFHEWLQECSLDLNDAYVTNVLKFPSTSSSSRIPVWEKKICRWFLFHEIKLVEPDFILLLGTDASQEILGAKISSTRGAPREVNFEWGKSAQVLPTIHPAQVSREPALKPGLLRDLNLFKNTIEGKVGEEEDVDYTCIDTEDRLESFTNAMLEHDVKTFALDCEWGGAREHAWLRSVQLSWAPGKAAYIALREASKIDDPPKKPGEDIIGVNTAKPYLKKLLCREGIKLTGHNLRSDERVFRPEFGFSLMPRLHFDSYVADILIEENRPHGLTECILRYTSMGRYDTELEDWKEEHPELNEDELGYGPVPQKVLFPYACKDADGQLRVAVEANKQLEGPPRKLFFDLLMPSQVPLAENERVGFKVNRKRVIEFTEIFKTACENKEAELKEMVEEMGGPEDFNPRSNPQLREVLFDLAGLTPLKTTAASGNRPWPEVAGLSDEEKNKEAIRASTDKETLAALEGEHPFISELQAYKAMYNPHSRLFKPFDRDEDGKIIPKEKSFLYYVTEDGFVKPEIRDDKVTGRRATKKPNVQNLPERRMSAVQAAVERDIPHIRTIITSPEDYVLLYVDYAQAELNVMAHAAEDETLIEVLNDPMRDLHGEQAIRMYDLSYDPSCGVDPKTWCKENGYNDQRNHAKVVDFGWPYQISARGLLGRMIAAGVDCELEDCERWLKLLADTYPTTEEYFKRQKEAVVDPGYVMSDWGRIKHLYEVDDGSKMAEQEREAANFRIQSDVAELIRLAMVLFVEERNRRNAKAFLAPDQHDALCCYVHVEDLEETVEEILPASMSARIPVIDLQLDYDVELFISLGEEPTFEELIARGLSPELANRYCKEAV